MNSPFFRTIENLMQQPTCSLPTTSAHNNRISHYTMARIAAILHSILWVVPTTPGAAAFVVQRAPVPSSSRTRTYPSKSVLSTDARRGTARPGGVLTLVVLEASAATSPEHVKSAGAGIPLKPSGNRLLFDPAQEGKLGGTSNLDDRIAQGVSYSYLPASAPSVASVATSTSTGTSFATTTTPPPGVVLQDAQHWLEDIGVPLNFAKPTAPVTATVLGRVKLIDDTAPGDIQHVVLQLPDGMHYVEGQSLSVIPPGIDVKTGKPHKPRLYSIASTRYGDLLDGKTVSLCVRRAEYIDPSTGIVDPTKQGVCSNYLCNLRPGEHVQVAGPVGKTMLLPHDPNRDIVMVATGTGTSSTGVGLFFGFRVAYSTVRSMLKKLLTN